MNSLLKQLFGMKSLFIGKGERVIFLTYSTSLIT